MRMAVAGDVTRPAGRRPRPPAMSPASPPAPPGAAPCRDSRSSTTRSLRRRWVIEGGREAAAAPLEIGEDAIPPLSVQCIELISEEALVIHAGPSSPPLFWLRVGAGYLTRGRCGEVVDSALHPIALPIAPL